MGVRLNTAIGLNGETGLSLKKKRRKSTDRDHDQERKSAVQIGNSAVQISSDLEGPQHEPISFALHLCLPDSDLNCAMVERTR